MILFLFRIGLVLLITYHDVALVIVFLKISSF